MVGFFQFRLDFCYSIMVVRKRMRGGREVSFKDGCLYWIGGGVCLVVRVNMVKEFWVVGLEVVVDVMQRGEGDFWEKVVVVESKVEVLVVNLVWVAFEFLVRS